MQRIGKAVWIAAALVVLTAAGVSGALIASAGRDGADREAQQKKGAPGQPYRLEAAREFPALEEGEMRDVVNILQLWTLSHDLELNEEQFLRLVPKHRRIGEMRERFWRGRPERIRQLADAAASQNDEQTRQSLKAFQAQEDKFWQEHSAAQQEILAELTPRQQARYLLLESESPRKSERMLRTLRRLGELRRQEIAGREGRPRDETAARRGPPADNSPDSNKERRPPL
jgi:hypothetical protein